MDSLRPPLFAPVDAESIILFVQLHDCEAQRFVDPEVDLSREPRTLGHEDRVLPFEAKLEADR